MNHEIRHATNGAEIRPSDHGDGVPMCNHMVCPRYQPPRGGVMERCAVLPGTGSAVRIIDVCIPAVRVMAKRLKGEI